MEKKALETTETIVLVYAKDSEIKVFSIENSKLLHNKLISEGWVHTQTLDACIFIEYLHNHCDETDLIEEVYSLTSKQ